MKIQDRSITEFDRWAPYYDLIHNGLPGEAQYYLSEALRSGGEVLELGCGTGRVCILTVFSGLRVTGLDISPRMLVLCREKLAALGAPPGPRVPSQYRRRLPPDVPGGALSTEGGSYRIGVLPIPMWLQPAARRRSGARHGSKRAYR